MGLSIAIIQRIVPHYRVPFFNKLKERLDLCGIEMTLYYGQERPGTVPRSVLVDAPWAIKLHNSYLSIGGIEFVWQPCLADLRRHDLVILEQANRLLINHALLFRRVWSQQKIAFWGHGRNLQARDQNSWREKFKRWRVCDVDWWFAYTVATRYYVMGNGFPSERITTVNNTIDTSDLKYALDGCSAQTMSSMKATFKIGDGPVGLYCGGLYREKRIDFLIDACRAIKDAIPDFHMMIIGEGPESDKVRIAAVACDWIHYVGPVYGNDRAPYLKLADLLLMPGAVGLVIIDSFTAETPLVTTNLRTHGPEIAYLDPGGNGVITENSIASYTEAVVNTLEKERLRALRSGCRNSAAMYSIESMVDDFAEGIVNCLSI